MLLALPLDFKAVNDSQSPLTRRVLHIPVDHLPLRATLRQEVDLTLELAKVVIDGICLEFLLLSLQTTLIHNLVSHLDIEQVRDQVILFFDLLHCANDESLHLLHAKVVGDVGVEL